MNRLAVASGAQAAPVASPPRLIFIAGPWTPVGGGMYKVADYLIQSQAFAPAPERRAVRLVPLDTRGGGHAAWGLPVLAMAIARVAWARTRGQVAGVHVNMAERMSLVRKSLLIVACRMLGVPVVLHLHAAQLHRLWPQWPAPVQALVRWVFSLPACCIALGQASARFMTSTLAVPASRVEVVINGVPMTQSRRSSAWGADRDPADPDRARGLIRLLFVGNLSRRKGVLELLQAIALPPLSRMKIHLTLAGGGDIAHYQAQADRLGVASRVRFAGWTGQAGISALLERADLLVLPSHDEGLPLAILEALAHGVAVVCTPVGEIPDILTDGLDAVFVPPGQAAALSVAIANLVAHPGRREAIARAGHALYRRRLTLDAFLAAIATVHHRCFGVAAAWREQPAGVPGQAECP